MRPLLSYRVNTRILRQNAKVGNRTLSKDKIKQYREIICDEIACYIGSTVGHQYLTQTERLQEIERFLIAIKNLLIGIQEKNAKKADNWKPKVSKRLYGLSPDSKKTIYRFLDDPYKDQPYLKRSLDNYITNGFDTRAMSILQKISEIDLSNLTHLSRTPLRDPPLHRLVMNLAPVWVDTTGRSLVHVSIDREYDHIRKNYFADWLCHLILAEGATPPNKQAISDIAKNI